ncbi:MAG: LacI family DNA-binding transcriptional regulator [Opitutaceae bacterium]|jgi:LacI family transcriptional regulator|nr:LacI family DNA-binding transcriptional regulator [Opitutaceae bacterium]
MTKLPTLRTLAAELGLSAATVSEALRDSPRVKEQTRMRVHQAAAAVGYRHNPLVGRVMADLRRGQLQGCRGVIGALNCREQANPLRTRFQDAVLHGANKRAEELGFRLEVFWVGEKQLSFRRLNMVLLTRGIQGVFVMPFEEPQDWSEVDWTGLSAVRLDYSLSRPGLHTISPDHHAALIHAVERLRERGYRRVGLFVRRAAEKRILFKWTGALMSYHQGVVPGERIPPLIVETLQREDFLAWFEAYRPDVVIGHHPIVIDWLAQRGLQVPKDVGFFNLNTTQEPHPSAGLDLLPRQLGAAAVESVVAQIQRSERGPPLHPKTISIEGAWVDGPTVRPAASA